MAYFYRNGYTTAPGRRERSTYANGWVDRAIYDNLRESKYYNIHVYGTNSLIQEYMYINIVKGKKTKPSL